MKKTKQTKKNIINFFYQKSLIMVVDKGINKQRMCAYLIFYIIFEENSNYNKLKNSKSI